MLSPTSLAIIFFMSAIYLVFYLVVNFILLYLFIGLILYLIKKVYKLTREQQKIIIGVFISIYLFIGVWRAFPDVLIQQSYNPEYLKLLDVAPLVKRLLDLFTWPMIVIGQLLTYNPH